MRPIFGTSLALAVFAASAVTGQPTGVRMTDDDIRDAYHKSYQYEKTQNYADAIKALTLLHQAYPEGYTVNLRLGWLYYLSGNFANAKLHYQTVIKVAPSSVEAKLGFMLPMLAQARYKDVEAMAKQVMEIDHSNYLANLRLAIALRMQKKFDQAEEVAMRMLVLYPTDLGFLTQLGLIKIAQKDPESATQLFTDILTLDPENVTAKQQLAVLSPPETP